MKPEHFFLCFSDGMKAEPYFITVIGSVVETSGDSSFFKLIIT